MWLHSQSFPQLRAVGQLVVHPPSRIVSHPKDKTLPWQLPAYLPSEKAVGTLKSENPYPGIHSVPYYVSCLRRCPLL